MVSPSTSTARSGPALTPRHYTYERRRPEQTPLYAVVRDHLETFYAAIEDGFVSAPLPKFVRDELEHYLDCGILCRGAALLTCDGCSEIKVVALSCKGRGFCPACLGRRMAETAANLADHVLPPAAPLRQWVLTFPFELRARLAFDAKLLSAVCSVAGDALLGFYTRALRDRAAVGWHGEGSPKLQSGYVAVVQRTNSDFRLNPHLHVLLLDGVYAEDAESPQAPPRFVPLPSLASADVADVVATIRARVLRLLRRRGVIEDDPSTGGVELSPCEAAERDPVLAQLSAAAVTGQVPAGPERRERPPLRLVPRCGCHHHWCPARS